jgi:N-methylhydantoinase B
VGKQIEEQITILYLQSQQVVNGGTGARPSKDGLSATAYPSGVRGTPVEINEAVAPLLFLRKEYSPGSGGKGKYNGGLGQAIEIKSAIDEDMDLLASFDRIKYPARGRLQGEDGKAGSVSIKNQGTSKRKGNTSNKSRRGIRNLYSGWSWNWEIF